MRNITITDKTTINPTEAYEFQYRSIINSNNIQKSKYEFDAATLNKSIE